MNKSAVGKHTPGPWKVSQSFPGRIFPDDRPPMCYAVIADVLQDIDDEYGKRELGKANASLIASAPELLEALKLAYKALDTDTEQNPQDTILMETIECAIIKAEGRV